MELETELLVEELVLEQQASQLEPPSDGLGGAPHLQFLLGA